MRKEAHPQSGSAVGASLGWGAEEERSPSQEREPLHPTPRHPRDSATTPRAPGEERSSSRVTGPGDALSPLLRLTGDVVRAEVGGRACGAAAGLAGAVG